jgi:hypothetical protein
MARELGDLPGRQAAEDLLGQLAALGLELVDLVGDVDFGAVGDEAQLVDLSL